MEGQIKDEGRKIVTSLQELPILKDDYVRVVHLTNEERVGSILENGLDYSSQGMAMATARAWSKAEEVEFSSTDPRFSHPGIRAIVFDLSNNEWKEHNRIGKASGTIKPNTIVAVINHHTK